VTSVLRRRDDRYAAQSRRERRFKADAGAEPDATWIWQADVFVVSIPEMALRNSFRLGFEIGREVWLYRRPFLLYLKPTPRCNCRCMTCSRWQGLDAEPEISIGEIRRMLAKFRRAGCAVLTLWGGEPTLRSDLGDILRAAKELGYRTSMCTNGGNLARSAEVVVSNLDVLLCSLDGMGPVHDEIRGVPGLFDRVVAGIEHALRIHPRCDVKIWTPVHQRNVAQLQEMASLARGLGVGIEFFPLTPISGTNDELVLSDADRAAAFAEVRRLRRELWPVRNPDRALSIMEQGGLMTCNFGRISIHVDHRGQVNSCEDAEGRSFFSWGGWEELDLDRLFKSREFRNVASRLRSCNQCRLPCAVELSGALTPALVGVFARSLN
jgi:MoaA/NifB/PqqE/SkfB family radical SAM enzyme